MKRLLSILATAVVLLVFTSLANAQATRTWVSGVGDDANPCSRTAPCKTFAGAISKTATDGEISVLDPGGYGAVTITKSITINGDGTLAGILAASVNGIIINAPSTSKVVIRNVSINGAGNGLDAIRFLSGKQLVVDHVNIEGFTGDGIDVALPSTGGTLFVQDTNIVECNTGIRVSVVAPGFATAVLDNVRLEGMVTGMTVGTNTFGHISRSSIVSNTSDGLLASATNATINVENSEIAFNANGVRAGASGATIRIAGNGIYNNTNGVAVIPAGGTVASDGNNRVSGNGASATPNGAITKQ
ncbi:MAG TPA: right-handed parallel beta-helix repeat-containing protein [Blastocatellia bacterium]|nr:right-handed parallel beta-helix repeat-containing protein [Blastocatellia bacterium]